MEKKEILFLFSLFLFFSVFTASLVARSSSAQCTTDDWYTCEGSYSVHYRTNSNCVTDSNRQYCANGCSGGYCSSAQTYTYPTYTYPTYTYPTQTTTYSPYYYYANYPTYYPYYYYYPTQTTTYYPPAANYNFAISISPTSQTASAGQAVTFTVTVTNIGNRADTYYLSTTFGTLSQTSIYLGQGSSQSVTLTVFAQSSGGMTIIVTANSASISLGKSASAILYAIPTQTVTSTITYTTSTSTITYSACTPAWTGSYSCSGNYVTQAYRNSDCSQTWMNTQYCQYGCSGGVCVGSGYPYQYPYNYNYNYYPSTCQASVSVTTPNDVYQGDYVSTTATITNVGGSTGTVNLRAYICYADGSNCRPIYCSNSINPSIGVPAQSVATVSCGTRTSYYYASPNAPYTNPNVNGNYYSGNYYNYPYSNYNYNYGNYYVTNTNTLPYYSTPYTVYPYAYNYNYQYYYNAPYSYNLPAGTYRIRLDWSGCGISDPTMYTGPFKIFAYQSPAAATATTTTTSTKTTSATSTTTTPATTATTTTYFWPFNFHLPGTGYLTGAYSWLASKLPNLPSLRTILVILLIVLLIILVVLASQWQPARSNRGEEEAFRTQYGMWNFQGTIKGRMQKVFKFNE